MRRRYINRNPRGIIGTPPAVKGRRHEEIQTEKYLEELFDHPPERHIDCQTEQFYLQAPPMAPYVPYTTGVDAYTQVDDGDLYDFDTEVEPLIQSIVNVSVEQAILEVLHEEQVAEMREQQQKFLALREAEMAELRRLEAEEQRTQVEKERRQHLEQVSANLDEQMRERATAAKMIQGYVSQMIPDVIDAIDVHIQGRSVAELQDKLQPWLAQQVAEDVGQMIDSRDLLEHMVRDIIEKRAEAYLSTVDEQRTDVTDANEGDVGMEVDEEPADAIQENREGAQEKLDEEQIERIEEL